VAQLDGAILKLGGKPAGAKTQLQAQLAGLQDRPATAQLLALPAPAAPAAPPRALPAPAAPAVPAAPPPPAADYGQPLALVG